MRRDRTAPHVTYNRIQPPTARRNRVAADSPTETIGRMAPMDRWHSQVALELALALTVLVQPLANGRECSSGCAVYHEIGPRHELSPPKCASAHGS